MIPNLYSKIYLKFMQIISVHQFILLLIIYYLIPNQWVLYLSTGLALRIYSVAGKTFYVGTVKLY